MSQDDILDLPPLPLLFPRFIEHKLVERTLCFYRNERIITEYGQRYDTPSFDDFCVFIFAHNLLCLTDSLLHTFIAECVAFAEDVLCTKDGEPLAVKFRGTKRETRWILESKGWAFPIVDPDGKTVMHVHADELMLSTMRTFFDHCGVGTLNSCGSVGQALMRRAWKEAYGASWKEHRHERPSVLCCQELRAHLIGARSDLFISKAEHIPHVRELDLKNAHAAASMWLPTGKNYRFLAGSKPEEYYLAYFAECQITIHEPLALGPFPMRDEKTGLILFPTQPGDYSSWLWSNEIEQTRRAGCTVITGNGHGWVEMTEDMAHWVELVSWLRDTAPTKPVEFFVKKAIVAGIGRFYMPEIKYILSEEWGEGAYEVIYEGLASTWWSVPQKDDKPYDMPHWFLWILSSVRCMLYQEMLARREAGARVVGSDTDAFYEDESVGDAPCYPSREDARTGDWRIKSHRTIVGKPTFPAKRHRNFEGAEKHPGRQERREHEIHYCA